MSNNALPLPWPFLPGDQPPDSFEHKAQENFDKLATEVGTLKQATGLEGTRIIWGIISSAGAIIAGNGFTATRTAAGDFTATFTNAFSARPSVTAMIGTTSGNYTVKERSTSPADGTAVRFSVFDTTSGAAADAQFHFQVIGPR